MIILEEIRMNSELKEGDTVSMNCHDVESACYAGDPTCETHWRAFHTVSNDDFSVCSRFEGLGGTDCQIQIGPYKSRTTYQGSGVVHIRNVRREERETYRCECVCQGNVVNSKYYYGVIILRK